ncbi:hypothetical protein LIA77_11913 [Sarocladium implicatum]|jgi:hypothetical protein|nr:hypothetical protein LIA77_11913 [Sarocladium implicatum]
MGLFSKKTKDDPSSSSDPTQDSSPPKKQGWYARFEASKRGEIRDEDLQKYLGKSKDEIMTWAENEPGVGKNQSAGKIDLGGASGLGGMAAADGYGGWGNSIGAKDKDGGLKYPPKQPEKKEVD